MGAKTAIDEDDRAQGPRGGSARRGGKRRDALLRVPTLWSGGVSAEMGNARERLPPGLGALRAQQLPQHEGQDAAVAVVIDFDGGIDAALERRACPRVPSARWMTSVTSLIGLMSSLEAEEVEGLGAVELQRLRR